MFKRPYVLLSILVLVLAACGGGGHASSSGQRVQITLSEFHIDASVRSFAPGTAYSFVVTNSGKTAHEFMVMPTGMMPGSSMDQMDQMAEARIDMLSPRETKTVAVTFPQADAGKALELACHLPGHYEAGMKLVVTVTT